MVSTSPRNPTLPTQPRVLVVDGLPETQVVLDAVFQPRGVVVDRVCAGHPLPNPASEQPHVVVLHDESEPDSGTSWNDVPRVFIGRRNVPSVGGRTDRGGADLPSMFDYGDLVRTIESLLKDRERAG